MGSIRSQVYKTLIADKTISEKKEADLQLLQITGIN